MCGIFGYVGNKGAAGIRIVLGEAGGSTDHGLKIAFVNSHLSAHIEQTDRRNWDFSEVVRRMMWEGINTTANEQTESTPPPKEGIKECDIVFWF